MDVLELLEHRNQCLRDVLSRSQAFLANPGSQDLLDDLLRERDLILKAMDHFEIEAKKCAISLTLGLETSIRALTDVKKTLIQQILELDQKLYEFIHQRSLDLMNELASTQNYSQKINRFKSQTSENIGESLDKRI